VIDFGKRAAWDVTGKTLPATLVPAGTDLVLTVDTSGAQYPATVDPLATNAAWVAESDRAEARFDLSVAKAGDVKGDGYSDVIVGAYPYDNGQTDGGRASVYLSSGAGLPRATATQVPAISLGRWRWYSACSGWSRGVSVGAGSE
jgi:hypothetical protein